MPDKPENYKYLNEDFNPDDFALIASVLGWIQPNLNTTNPFSIPA